MAVNHLAAALERISRTVALLTTTHAALAAARSSGRRGCASSARCLRRRWRWHQTGWSGPWQLLGIGVAHGVGKVSAAHLHGTELVEFLGQSSTCAITSWEVEKMSTLLIGGSGMRVMGSPAPDWLDALTFGLEHFAESAHKFVGTPEARHHACAVLSAQAGLVKNLDQFQRDLHVVWLPADEETARAVSLKLDLVAQNVLEGGHKNLRANSFGFDVIEKRGAMAAELWAVHGHGAPVAMYWRQRWMARCAAPPKSCTATP